MYQPGKVANPVRYQLNREIIFPLFIFAPENLVSRGNRFGHPIPIFYTQPPGLLVVPHGIPLAFRDGDYIYILCIMYAS